MSVTQLGYLGIGVSDVSAWEDYATNVLGLQVSGREEDGSLRLRMDLYQYRFILHPSGEDDLLFAGWEVKDEAALNDMAKRLTDAGVAVEAATADDLTARRVIGLIKFKDPAGLDTEVFYGPHLDKSHPFNSPRGITGFMTGEHGNMGLGHIVVQVPDLGEALKFYRDVMGLRISDFIDMNIGTMELRMAFFHCNQRHHSIAFAGPRAARPASVEGGNVLGGPRKRLNHFMLEVKALDDVGITYGLVENRAIPAGKLGRHTNDQMFSFYMVTPSGFNVEYGWDGRKVDDEVWEVQYYQEASIWGHGNQPRPSALAPVGATR